MGYNPRDHYFKKAKEQNFAARSIFKLEEIDKKLRLLKQGQFVLDLGAAPGSWSQYVSQKVGNHGFVLGIDLTPIKLNLKNAYFHTGDIYETDIATLLESIRESGISSKLPSGADKFDLVISDMAPKTSGIRLSDQAKSFELCERALSLARQHLKPGGHFVCKLFFSDDFQALKKAILSSFERFEAVRPDSTRKSSKEIFLIGLKKK